MAKPVDSQRFGVSFSRKQCMNFGLRTEPVLDWLIEEAGFRRFRLMSYWNEHEREPGKLDFSKLDLQIAKVAKAGGVITLCLGARQPRWPENHWPDWAWELPKDRRSQTLLRYLQIVVERYRDEPAVVSYQLENEALLENFGTRAEVDRARLRAEFQLVKRLDPSRPVIMATSTSWGIPLRRPIPDIVGFSYYHTLYRKGGYHYSTFAPWVHRLRKNLIYLLHHKPTFIHELQLEPWGPAPIWKMDTAEQEKSMDTAAIRRNINLARAIQAPPTDLWGGEWWYWRLQQGDTSIWQAVKAALD